ncbi:microfibril-associated glycoprotein 4-like [Crassostrea angulata]|uniref:microfibril-associated glycoprotein 4-like n=1 Tax=Magallana angulata TaxID=2784310 RepID=UPI0022B091F9|nr:microfibril-associated glycoprotein 4-like [Crassostrea angulata]
MNRSLFFFVFSTVIKIIIASSQSGEFVYRGNVSNYDVSLLISETGPDDVSLRYCAAECYKNVDCNAVELCSFPTKQVCRLNRSITTALITGQETCSRHEIVHACDDDSFFNRRTAKCQCAIDCDCDAVMPPSGGILPKTVKIDSHVILTNCINTGGHVWTMIQRRMDGSVNFYRGWNEYKNGFGSIDSEFWIGLDNIHRLVQNGYTILRVELEEGTDSAFAEYSSFYIAGEADKYRIHVSGYSGTAGDGISCPYVYCNNNAQFSTYDNDNDAVSTNEASRWRGAWWYNDGHMSHLNGEYGNSNHGQGINWYFFKGWANSLSGARMMLRLG